MCNVDSYFSLAQENVEIRARLNDGAKTGVRIMRKIILVLALMLPAHAYAVNYYLESCEYKYIPEKLKSMYVGTYKSDYGNYWTGMFDSYCPSLITK